MVIEATQVVNANRIESRRRELIEKHTPIENPIKTNETLFGGDADFFEVVMADKFGFRKLIYTFSDSIIEPTVKGVPQPARYG